MAPPSEGRPQPGDTSDLQQAVILHRAGRLAEAEQFYAAILAADPRHFDALHLLGLLRHQQGHSLDALRVIAAALNTNPKSVDALSNYGIVLAALNHHDAALESFDKALALARDHVHVLNNRGLTLAALGRRAEALASWDEALAIDPNHVEALHNLGNTLQELRRHDDALAAYARALAIRPDHVGILNDCGGSLAALGRLEAAVNCYDRALAVNPNLTEVHINRGNTLADLHRFPEALASYAEAAASRPDCAEASWSESVVRLRLGQLGKGWRGYEWRWRKTDWVQRRRDFAAPLWLGEEPLAGRTILLHGEQGLGDTLQFVRYAPLVAGWGGKVVLEVQPPLKQLLATVAGITRIVSRGETLPAFDLHCPLMSLPLAFGTELHTIPADIPYIRIPQDRLAKWRRRLAQKTVRRIGIVWAGSELHINDHNRSIALERFASVLSIPGVEFVNLQKEARAEQAAVLRAGNVLQIGDELRDFADTAAVVSLLDLIISVDTSVAHLAGALGRPVWVLLPFSPDFRWLLERDDSPWYPTARLFRQPRVGDWDSVLERVRRALTPMSA
jgi:tetratricopeptide (TPR) repeat protein